MAAPIHIALYSFTGHTREAGAKLAALLGAASTVEAIEPLSPPSRTPWGFIRIGFGAYMGNAWPIRPLEQPAERGKLLVVGSPVWAGRLPPPVRSYLRQAAARYDKLAMLITQGGSALVKYDADVLSAAGKQPALTVALTDADRKTGDAVERKLVEFAAGLGRLV